MADTFKKKFGKRVKVLRRVKGITQESLAEMLNISTISVANIEAGRCAIGFSKLPLLAKSLDVEIYQLFSDIDYTDSSNTKGYIITLLDTATTKQLNVIKNVVQEIIKL